jgi:hypothetical protein
VSRRSRLAPDAPEGESYFISMTDMMVGVVFIFIILLGYFASQLHATTSRLTRSDNPQTDALLESAKNLQPTTVEAQVDHAQKVVCLPGQALRVAINPGQENRRCFSYADKGPTRAETRANRANRERADITLRIAERVAAPSNVLQADEGSGRLTFDASTLFFRGTDRLSPAGLSIANRVGAELAAILPCHGSLAGFDDRNCETRPDERVSAIVVLASSGVDPFTEEGQAASALALRRSVAFHRALTAAEPVLAKVNDPSGTRRLLQLASLSRSAERSRIEGRDTIDIQVEMGS